MNSSTAITVIYVILAIIVLINGLYAMQLNKIMFRHQKAIEWFSEHVILDPRSLPHDAPEDLLDLIDKQEAKAHDTK